MDPTLHRACEGKQSVIIIFLFFFGIDVIKLMPLSFEFTSCHFIPNSVWDLFPCMFLTVRMSREAKFIVQL